MHVAAVTGSDAGSATGVVGHEGVHRLLPLARVHAEPFGAVAEVLDGLLLLQLALASCLLRFGVAPLGGCKYPGVTRILTGVNSTARSADVFGLSPAQTYSFAVQTLVAGGLLSAPAVATQTVTTLPAPAAQFAANVPQLYAQGRLVDALTATPYTKRTYQISVWANSLAQFGPSPPGSHATQLPTDHHELQGMVAPRGLLVIENTGMVWLGNVSVWANSNAGHKVFEALQVPDHMGFSQVGNHNHCQFPASQEPTVEAFVRKFLLDDASANTTIMYTDAGFVYDNAKWSPWTVPVLS